MACAEAGMGWSLHSPVGQEPFSLTGGWSSHQLVQAFSAHTPTGPERNHAMGRGGAPGLGSDVVGKQPGGCSGPTAEL